MKVGFFTDSYFPRKDGASYTLQLWKERMEDKGVEAHIYHPESSYTPGEREHPVKSVGNPFYRGHNVPLPGFCDVDQDLDVVHVHSPWVVGYSGLRYAEREDLPAIYTYHTDIPMMAEELLGNLGGSTARRMLEWMDRRWLSRFDLVTCSTDISRVPVDCERLPVGVNDEFFRPYGDSYLGNETVVGYAGRMSEEKNLEELLQLAEVSDRNFLLCGEGRSRQELESQAPQNVSFKDFVPRGELPRLLSAMDVFAMTSRSETFCLTVLEANLCGTPVLAPEVEPFTETLSGSSGMLYRPGDIDDMERKMEAILEGSFEPREAALRYSVDGTIDRLMEMYESLMESNH